MRLIARPIDVWPGELTAEDNREYTSFKASWTATWQLLAREVEHLAPDAVLDPEVVVQLALRDRDLRLDGWIRADARPEHPGVIVSFSSKHGPLRYHTDRFTNRGWSGYLPGWQSNVRAIALGLEALRRVDRYGIAQAGEQYRGWNALPAGRAMGAAMTVEQAAQLLADAAGTSGLAGSDDPEVIHSAWRRASRTAHPDAGGDPDLFRQLTEARDLLLESSRG